MTIRTLSLSKIIICFLVINLLLVVTADTVSAATEEGEPLACRSCHIEKLDYHDKLGDGNEACWTCHDATDMSSLHLADGRLLPLTEASQLCGQCHQARYAAWQQGTHGFPGTSADGSCTDCHNPHEPQISLLDITRPHPPPAPPSPPPPSDLVMILGISLVFLTGLVIVVARQRSES